MLPFALLYFVKELKKYQGNIYDRITTEHQFAIHIEIDF